MYRISWPNRITLARIMLVGPFVMMLLHLQDQAWGHHARYAALVIFAIMAISDGLDGYLARRFHQESTIGRFLDPMADKLLILCSVVCLAHPGTHVTGMLLPDFVAIIVISKDLIIVLGFLIIYLSTAKIYIDPKRTGKWCTTLQLLMVISILLSPDLPHPISRVPVILWWAASAMAIATVVHYFQLGRRFISEHEPSVKGQTNLSEKIDRENPENRKR